MMYKVPFIRPSFPNSEDLLKDYKQILASNWYTNFGPFEQQFSQRIADYVGPNLHAETFSSATAALMACILSILGKGDNTRFVLMPSFTFAAGADVLLLCGYKPLFIDIEKHGLQSSLKEAKNAIKDKSYKDSVCGILLCNTFGVGNVYINDWENLADEAGLPLIIDSAAGFGSLYNENRKVGSAGSCEVFSFHATKPFAIGEGGAVVTKDKSLTERLRSIQNFGFDSSHVVTRLGFNGKLQEINAAIGLRQFETFDTIIRGRRAVLAEYKNRLDKSRFRFQSNAELASLCFATVLVIDQNTRDEHMKNLLDKGVEAKAYYSPPLHKHEVFSGLATYGNLAITEQAEKSVISLPIHDNMKSEHIDLIINTLNG